MEFRQREDETRKKHESEMSELKQELFSLSVKVYMTCNTIRGIHINMAREHMSQCIGTYVYSDAHVHVHVHHYTCDIYV